MPAILSPEAVQDLAEVWDFIARDNPDAADRVLSMFEGAFDLLVGRPLLGHTRKDLADESIRFWPLASYLIAYQPQVAGVRIIAVLHGARDVAKLVKDRGRNF
jgi:plasmid stabilization system protein ParE